MTEEDDDPATNFSTDGYLICQRLNPNRVILLQNAETLQGKAAAGALPAGVTDPGYSKNAGHGVARLFTHSLSARGAPKYYPVEMTKPWLSSFPRFLLSGYSSTIRGHAPFTQPKWRRSFANSGASGSGQTGLPDASR